MVINHMNYYIPIILKGEDINIKFKQDLIDPVFFVYMCFGKLLYYNQNLDLNN